MKVKVDRGCSHCCSAPRSPCDKTSAWRVADLGSIPAISMGIFPRPVQPTNKLRTAQRAMEKKMLDLKLKDKIPCSKIRKRTKIIDIIEYTLKQKWKWAGHIARLKDNRWTR